MLKYVVLDRYEVTSVKQEIDEKEQKSQGSETPV
jgi:hypothetical protein